MISLDVIKKTKHATPPRILLHGQPKIGKSTFSACAPNPIFIQTEDGLNGIDAQAFPLAKSSKDVREYLMALMTQPHEFKTVVLDSADWFEKIVHEELCKADNKKIITEASGGYGKAYIESHNYFKDILNLLDELNKSRGMFVIVICHSSIQEVKDPEKESYDIATLKLHKTASALLTEWADIIGYGRRPVVISKNNIGEFKAINNENVINELVIKSASCMSGSRYNLPNTLPLIWADFYNAFINSMN